ncbi:MAG: SRPBCC family protein [Cyclobacteriaceae bacterium]
MMKNSLHKDIWIDAPVERVFACFTDEKSMLSWHGKEVELDPRPGGIYKVVFENGTTILGEYKEVQLNERVVYSAKYGEVESLISIEFLSKNGGTRLILHQDFDPTLDTSSFNEGWDYFLDLLVTKIGK